MKSSALKRRKPLSRGAAHDDAGHRRYSTFKNSGARLKRRVPRRLAKRAAIAPFRRFVQGLPCMSCHAPGPSEAAHVALSANQKGIAMKVPDSQQVPLCWKCHGEFDGRIKPSRFDVLSREQRWETAARWVRLVRMAVTPEDLGHARELESLGLGRVVFKAGRPGWLPLPGLEVAT